MPQAAPSLPRMSSPQGCSLQLWLSPGPPTNCSTHQQQAPGSLGLRDPTEPAPCPTWHSHPSTPSLPHSERQPWAAHSAVLPIGPTLHPALTLVRAAAALWGACPQGGGQTSPGRGPLAEGTWAHPAGTGRGGRPAHVCEEARASPRLPRARPAAGACGPLLANVRSGRCEAGAGGGPQG